MGEGFILSVWVEPCWYNQFSFVFVCHEPRMVGVKIHYLLINCSIKMFPVTSAYV